LRNNEGFISLFFHLVYHGEENDPIDGSVSKRRNRFVLKVARSGLFKIFKKDFGE